MRNGRSALAILGLLAAVAAPAAAQDKGIYLGGAYGYAQYKDSCKLLIIPCDDHDPAWRFFGGYRFSRTWSAELGYADLGSVTGEGTVGAGPASLRQTTKAWDLIGVFSLPIADRLSAFGKLGMYRARTAVDVTTVASGPLHAGGTNSGFSYGAGLGYDLGRIGVRAGWQRYENTGTDSTGEDDIDVFSIDLLWRF